MDQDGDGRCWQSFGVNMVGIKQEFLDIVLPVEEWRQKQLQEVKLSGKSIRKKKSKKVAEFTSCIQNEIMNPQLEFTGDK